MIKTDLINNLHKIFRNDPYLNNLFEATGITMDEIVLTMDDMLLQYFIDTATEWGIEIWERLLQIEPFIGSTLDERKSRVLAKWRSDTKADIDLLQQIANSWKNGEIQVKFVSGKIQLTFTSIFGVPTDLEGLEFALDEAKPAHLAIEYIFKYLLIKDIHNVMTIADLETQLISKFAF